jgi:hypothetical protein
VAKLGYKKMVGIATHTKDCFWKTTPNLPHLKKK